MDAPVLRQVNLVVRDMEASIAFYRRLGISVPDAVTWPPDSDARHVDGAMRGGIELDLDNFAMARIYDRSRANEASATPVAILGFSLVSREAVDARYAELVGAGYVGRQPPYDAFWGARYAIVEDPDGNPVGLMSPIERSRQYVPSV